MYDVNSRYNDNDIDQRNIVFMTPTQALELNIGIENSWDEDEMDTEFPFVVDVLKEMIKETTIGATNGSMVYAPVDDSLASVFVCVQIHGKLCKLQNGEWNETTGWHGLSKANQLKTFQRLLSLGEITLDDLAAEDIDNDIYKTLVANDINGVEICHEKLSYIDRLVEEQRGNKSYIKKLQRVNEMRK